MLTRMCTLQTRDPMWPAFIRLERKHSHELFQNVNCDEDSFVIVIAIFTNTIS